MVVLGARRKPRQQFPRSLIEDLRELRRGPTFNDSLAQQIQQEGQAYNLGSQVARELCSAASALHDPEMVGWYGRQAGIDPTTLNSMIFSALKRS